MDRLIPDTGLALAVKSVLAVMRKLDPIMALPRKEAKTHIVYYVSKKPRAKPPRRKENKKIPASFTKH